MIVCDIVVVWSRSQNTPQKSEQKETLEGVVQHALGRDRASTSWTGGRVSRLRDGFVEAGEEPEVGVGRRVHLDGVEVRLSPDDTAFA